MPIALAATLAACGKVYDESGSRTYSAGRPLLTTASVRTIQKNTFSQINEGSGRVVPTSINCAEPSPDVALALGEGRSGGVNLSGLQTLLAPPAAAADAVAPSPADVNLALSLASSHAEAVAQLGERLATIQLLRDGLYRACEAYANGAITPTIYTLMVSRMDELLVTLLSTEIGGGAFGRQFATAAAGGSADAQASQAAAAAGEEEARAKLEAANEAAAKVAAEQNTLDQLQAQLDATAPDAPERAAFQQQVDTQRGQVEMAQDDLETKQQEALDALGSAMVQLTVARSAAQGVAGAGGTIQGRTRSTVSEPAREIREMQVSYLNDTNADAAIVACIAELANTPVRSTMPPPDSAGPAQLVEPTMLAYLCAQQFAGDIRDFISRELAIKREQMKSAATPALAEARIKMAFADMARESCRTLQPE